MRDLIDVEMNGNQHTVVNLGGNGRLSDVLTFTLDHPDGDDIEYQIYYEDVDVVNGAAGGGERPQFRQQHPSRQCRDCGRAGAGHSKSTEFFPRYGA